MNDKLVRTKEIRDTEDFVGPVYQTSAYDAFALTSGYKMEPAISQKLRIEYSYSQLLVGIPGPSPFREISFGFDDLVFDLRTFLVRLEMLGFEAGDRSIQRVSDGDRNQHQLGIHPDIAFPII